MTIDEGYMGDKVKTLCASFLGDEEWFNCLDMESKTHVVDVVSKEVRGTLEDSIYEQALQHEEDEDNT